MKKKLFLLSLLLILAMASSALGADVTYYLSCDCPGTAVGTSGTRGFQIIADGTVYNSAETLVGNFFMTVDWLGAHNGTGQGFLTLHMVELESGGPPWYNFTLFGSYSDASLGSASGAIANITDYPESLTGASFTMGSSPLPAYLWELTLNLP